MKNPVIAAEYVLQDIASLLEVFPQLAEDEELFKDTLEGNTNFNEVIDRLLSEMKDNETLAEATSSRIGKLRERQTRLVHRAQFYRALIHRLMERAGIKSVALPEAKISVVNSPDKVIITDEDAILDKFMRITKEPNKAAIKAALKNGEYVPGATLSNGGTTISVR
jgi:phage host-nuclease inhibitor protein Gam